MDFSGVRWNRLIYLPRCLSPTPLSVSPNLLQSHIDIRTQQPPKTIPNTAPPIHVTLPSDTMLFNCSLKSITVRHVFRGGGQKKSIVAASRPSQNGRRRSGLKRSRNRLQRHSPTMKWRRRSGLTRPTGAAPTVAPRGRGGRPSTWVWSSARSVQVRDVHSPAPWHPWALGGEGGRRRPTRDEVNARRCAHNGHNPRTRPRPTHSFAWAAGERPVKTRFTWYSVIRWFPGDPRVVGRQVSG